jgi:hypothetical protein
VRVNSGRAAPIGAVSRDAKERGLNWPLRRGENTEALRERLASAFGD